MESHSVWGTDQLVDFGRTFVRDSAWNPDKKQRVIQPSFLKSKLLFPQVTFLFGDTEVDVSLQWNTSATLTTSANSRRYQRPLCQRWFQVYDGNRQALPTFSTSLQRWVHVAQQSNANDHDLVFTLARLVHTHRICLEHRGILEFISGFADAIAFRKSVLF